ncbi:MAG: 7-cyano-7-deazaguanine synthase QueC [Woeseiaceae bacterium]
MDSGERRQAEQRALVLLSGGQDSTTCLYWAINRFGADEVDTLTFDYGQRHRIELDAAREVAAFAGVRNTMLHVDTFRELGGNALTDPAIEVEEPAEGLPNTFVPGRNLVFLTYAAALAWQRDILHLVTGVAQTDYSGYPDCRQPTLSALEDALRLGMEREFRIHAPLMRRSKRQTVELARELGALPAMALTHTCYEGSRPPCGSCPACRLRARGFAEAGVADPLLSP